MRFPKARRWLAGLLAAAAALVYPTPITATMPAANALLTANLTVEVRDAVTNGIASMLGSGASVQQALTQAQSDADAAIEDYNTRVGG